MPERTLRPCRTPGCPELVAQGCCHAHSRQVEQRRGSAAARGYNHRWRQARITYLRSHALCVVCRAQGTVRAATEVDHIIPHGGNQWLFWDQANWQALCHTCHSAKTMRELNASGAMAPPG